MTTNIAASAKKASRGAAPALNDTSGRGPDFVAALERGLTVLETFGRGRERLTLSEVAAHTKLSRGTARRFLLTLVELQFLASDGKNFWLTPKVLNLSHGYLTSFGRGEVARPVLQAVSDRFQESCSMAVLEGADVVYVARVEARRVFSSRIDVGTRLPAHCSSLGRVLLAALPEDQFEAWMARHDLVAWTERTITDPGRFRARIQDVRRARHAIIDGEIELGSRSIAVPIVNRSGATVAALNIGTSAARVSLDQLRRTFLPVLREAAQQIGGALDGW
ncbi:IclR family transcriptional regulator domain-containing protein [Teichococcus oryzae]|uniref:IclR family transcriptional regulator domain-containing protein n=1 Tax=Teichococcus oryzae TaxID=1608942 RepID=UPI001F500C49|nr:IclR family transcriptional regulator C-terminal domain-containing protein [Pseudoroseomonas oryzae]